MPRYGFGTTNCRVRPLLLHWVIRRTATGTQPNPSLLACDHPLSSPTQTDRVRAPTDATLPAVMGLHSWTLKPPLEAASKKITARLCSNPAALRTLTTLRSIQLKSHSRSQATNTKRPQIHLLIYGLAIDRRWGPKKVTGEIRIECAFHVALSLCRVAAGLSLRRTCITD